MVKIQNTGLIGLGRLGKVLAQKMTLDRLYVYDCRESILQAEALKLGLSWLPLNKIVVKADLLLLAIPPDEIIPFVQQNCKRMKDNIVLINLATKINTSEIKQTVVNKKIRIISVKLIGQYVSLLKGLESIFVTDNPYPELTERINSIFSPLGKVRHDKTESVYEWNAEATRWALKTAVNFRKQLLTQSVPGDVIRVLINNICAGTLMEYEPDSKNQYIKARLNELRQQKLI